MVLQKDVLKTIMLKLCLNVLISVFVLMFSASVGLSAVYECRFYAKLTSDLTSGLMKVDTIKRTVSISSSNAWVSKKSKGPHEITISDNGNKIEWRYGGFIAATGWTSDPRYANLDFVLRLSTSVGVTQGHLSVKEGAWRRWGENRGKCKLIKTETVTAEVKTPTKTESIQKHLDKANI